MFHSFCTVLMLVLLLLLFVLLTLRALCISSPLFDVCFFLFREINLANTQRIRIPVPECNVNCPLFSLFSFWFIVRFFFASFIRFSPSTWTTEPGSCWCSPLSVCVCLCEWYFFYRERISTWFFFLSWLAIIGFYSIFCTNMSSAFFIQGWKLHRNNAFKYASDKMIICSGKLGSSTGWSKKMRNFCFGRFSFLNVWCGVAFCLFRKHVWIHGMPLRS